MFAKIKNFAKKRKFGLRVRIDPVGFILGLSQSKSLQKKNVNLDSRTRINPKGFKQVLKSKKAKQKNELHRHERKKREKLHETKTKMEKKHFTRNR
jgi:hypothetical protein